MKKKATAVVCIALMIIFLTGTKDSIPAQASVPETDKQAVDTLIQIETSDPEIVEEIACDYISEDAIALQEQLTEYNISDWVLTENYGYVYFDQDFSGPSPVHQIKGYVKNADGCYIYVSFTTEGRISQEEAGARLESLL